MLLGFFLCGHALYFEHGINGNIKKASKIYKYMCVCVCGRISKRSKHSKYKKKCHATTFEIVLKLLKQLKLHRVSTRTHVMQVVIGVENELIINHHIHIGDEIRELEKKV